MFHSSGYFKAVTCPYFASGLCERPYCHFRHVRPSQDEKPSGSLAWSTAVSSSSSGSSLLTKVGETIQKLQRDIERDQQLLNGHRGTKSRSVETRTIDSFAGAVVDKFRPRVTLADAKTSDGNETVFSYQPTPISELEKKRKESPEERKRPVEEEVEEYNPETKRVKFDESDDDPVGKFSDGDSEVDDEPGAIFFSEKVPKEKVKEKEKPEEKLVEEKPSAPGDILSQIMQDSSKSLNLTSVKHNKDGSMVVLEEKKKVKKQKKGEKVLSAADLCLELSDEEMAAEIDPEPEIMETELEEKIEEEKIEEKPSKDELEKIELAKKRESVWELINSGAIVLGHIPREDEKPDEKVEKIDSKCDKKSREKSTKSRKDEEKSENIKNKKDNTQKDGKGKTIKSDKDKDLKHEKKPHKKEKTQDDVTGKKEKVVNVTENGKKCSVVAEMKEVESDLSVDKSEVDLSVETLKSDVDTKLDENESEKIRKKDRNSSVESDDSSESSSDSSCKSRGKKKKRKKRKKKHRKKKKKRKKRKHRHESESESESSESSEDDVRSKSSKSSKNKKKKKRRKYSSSSESDSSDCHHRNRTASEERTIEKESVNMESDENSKSSEMELSDAKINDDIEAKDREPKVSKREKDKFPKSMESRVSEKKLTTAEKVQTSSKSSDKHHKSESSKSREKSDREKMKAETTAKTPVKVAEFDMFSVIEVIDSSAESVDIKPLKSSGKKVTKDEKNKARNESTEVKKSSTSTNVSKSVSDSGEDDIPSFKKFLESPVRVSSPKFIGTNTNQTKERSTSRSLSNEKVAIERSFSKEKTVTNRSPSKEKAVIERSLSKGDIDRKKLSLKSDVKRGNTDNKDREKDKESRHAESKSKHSSRERASHHHSSHRSHRPSSSHSSSHSSAHRQSSHVKSGSTDHSRPSKPSHDKRHDVQRVLHTKTEHNAAVDFVAGLAENKKLSLQQYAEKKASLVNERRGSEPSKPVGKVNLDRQLSERLKSPQKTSPAFSSLFGDESDDDVVLIDEPKSQLFSSPVRTGPCKDIVDLTRSSVSKSPDHSDGADDVDWDEDPFQTEHQDVYQNKNQEDRFTIPKKRLSHDANFSRASASRVRPSTQKTFLSPAEQMHNRFKMVQQRKTEAAAAAASTPRHEHSEFAALNAPVKMRVAHTAKWKNNGDQTQIKTSKGSRTAHVPKEKVLARPLIPDVFGSRVPTVIRQRYLNQLIDECLRIYNDQQASFDRALHEEKTIYEKSSSKVVYLNVAVKAIRALRTESANQAGTSAPQKTSKTWSHQAVLGGAKAAKTTYTLHRSGHVGIKKDVELTLKIFSQYLQQYILTEDQLKENGFPLVDPDNSELVRFYKEETTPKGLKLHEKVCARCGKRFRVYPDGTYATEEECNYHWGRAYKRKVSGQWESRYNCCSGDLSSEPCCSANIHVHESNKQTDLEGYVKTYARPAGPDGYGIFALDCEMVYTVAGSELARLTVIDMDMEPVYETLVKPQSKVIDYNTRFSGLEEGSLNNVRTTLPDVQNKLRRMFSEKTILMGHSLESDFTALKLVHPTVVDTSVVFPHRLGAPYKRALRNLMGEILKKIIQNDVGGHDSREDAMACMELMVWKVKEELRVQH